MAINHSFQRHPSPESQGPRDGGRWASSGLCGGSVVPAPLAWVEMGGGKSCRVLEVRGEDPFNNSADHIYMVPGCLGWAWLGIKDKILKRETSAVLARVTISS